MNKINMKFKLKKVVFSRKIRRLRKSIKKRFNKIKRWYKYNKKLSIPVTMVAVVFLVIVSISIYNTYSRIGFNQNVVNTDIASNDVWYRKLVDNSSSEELTYATYDDSITTFSGGVGSENDPFIIDNPKQLELIGQGGENLYRQIYGLPGPNIVQGYFDYEIVRTNAYNTAMGSRQLYYFHDQVKIINNSGRRLTHMKLTLSSNDNANGDVFTNGYVHLNGVQVSATSNYDWNNRTFTVELNCNLAPTDEAILEFDVTSYSQRSTFNVGTFEMTADGTLYYSRSVYEPVNSTEGMYYKINANLDMGGVMHTPIGFNESDPFRGILDGDYHTIKNLHLENDGTLNHTQSYGLVGYSKDGTVKNITFENVTADMVMDKADVDFGFAVGNIKGASKVYNIGVKSGYVNFNHLINRNGALGTVVGYQADTSAVVNCYSYANININSRGGSLLKVGGVVGNRAGDAVMRRNTTVVFLLVYYGEINSNYSDYQFVYNGTKVDTTQTPCYCYYLYRNDNKDTNTGINTTYAILKTNEEMSSDGFMAHLNNYRYMASYLLGIDANPRASKTQGYPQIAKWKINNNEAIYPIQEKYAKNLDPRYDEFATTESEARSRFGNNNYIAVNFVNMSASANAGNNRSRKLYFKIFEKNESINDYTNHKIIMPFNSKYLNFTYAGNDVNGFDMQVTGWTLQKVTYKGTSIGVSDDPVSFRYNYALREGHAGASKDIGTLFAQGGYYLVPDGVTEITVQVKWARVIYVSDQYNDYVYNTNYVYNQWASDDYGNAFPGSWVEAGKTKDNPVIGLRAAYEYLSHNVWGSDVSSMLFVLVGNVHQDAMRDNYNPNNFGANHDVEGSIWPNNGWTTDSIVSITSLDEDGDLEPDYSLYVHNYHDMNWPTIRFDFVNILGYPQVGTINGKLNELSMKADTTLEMTETVITDRIDIRHKDSNTFKLNGGFFNIYNEWFANDSEKKKNFIYFGGNARAVYMNSGSESTSVSSAKTTIPVLVVTGGRIETLSSTYFNPYITVNDDVYIFVDGGYINKLYSTYKSPVNGTAFIEVNNSYINYYYAGGAADSATVNHGVSTIIKNSRIGEFYGGPEFGSITGGSKSYIYNSVIDKVYGGGYGGTQTTEVGLSFKDSGGYCSNTNYIFNIQYSCNNNDNDTNVYYCLGRKDNTYGLQTGYYAMIYSKAGCPAKAFAHYYSSLSAATVDNVELNIKDSTVNDDIYGGGNKGVVSQNVIINLENVIVHGSIYGGGLSNENESVEVMDINSDFPVPSFISYTVDSEPNYPKKTLIWSDNSSILNAYNNYHNSTHIYSPNVSLLGQVNGNIYLNIKNSQVDNDIYGGGNASDVNGNIFLNLYGEDNDIAGSVYGGGNEAEVTGDIDIRLSDGEYKNVYGGGNKGNVNGEATITVKRNIKANNIFAGGNQSTATNSVIYFEDGQATNVYGGSNSSGNVDESHVNIGVSNDSSQKFLPNNYEMKKLDPTKEIVAVKSNGSSTIGEAYPNLSLNDSCSSRDITFEYHNNAAQHNGDVTFKITNKTNANIRYFHVLLELPLEYYTSVGSYNTLDGERTWISGNSLFWEFDTKREGWSRLMGAGPGQTVTIMDVNSDFTHWVSNSGGTVRDSFYIKAATITGYGSNGVNYSSTTCHDPAPDPGSNPTPGGGEEPDEMVWDVPTYDNIAPSGIIDVTNVYGGNNAGGITNNSNVYITGENTIVENVYGGGNEAPTGKTNILIENGNGIEKVFGGGRLGVVNNSTNVIIDSSNIKGNVFGGGEGSAAVVNNLSSVTIKGDSVVKGSVFGGGDAANTGTTGNNNATVRSKVDILGGTVWGNVYGGANTAIIYGIGEVKIGSSTNTEDGRLPILIKGTVFGGGESSDAGNQHYDYSFNSVTQGINIDIIGTDENTVFIEGSIFGSGNAANSGGFSHINITKLGTDDYPNYMSSIQRADDVNIYDSKIVLAGATDSPNEFDYYLYSMSRINSLTIANNTSIYLEHDFNLVQEFNSMLVDGDTREKATVTIEDGVITKNVDNRLYSAAKKSNSVNIRNTESEVNAEYQDVNGMTFFGLYISDSEGNINEGIYDSSVVNGNVVPENIATLFKSGSYVRARHKANHDKTVDGFYSNFADPETFAIETKYVPVTSEEFQYYEWAIGEQTTDFDLDLIASKYATTGTGVIEFADYNVANSYFQILDFGGGALASDVTLIDSNSIPRIAPTNEEAIQKFGLKMSSSDDSWITDGSTEFFYDGTSSSLSGTTLYYKDNSNNIPTLEFYLAHSRNIDVQENLGTAVICIAAYVPQDELTYKLTRININVNIRSIVEEAEGYEGAMTSGRRTEIFVNGNTNVSSKSQLSAYYSMFMEGNSFADGGYRYIESTYKLPINTRITMIDRSIEERPVYYYYVVTEDNYDVPSDLNLYTKTNSPTTFYQYRLSDFIRMGSISNDNKYSDIDANNSNYYAELDFSAEEYIFTFDFSETDIPDSVGSAELFLTYQKEDVRHTQLSTFRGTSNNSLYNLIKDGGASLLLNVPEGSETAYVGQEFTLPANIVYNESIVGGRKVADTRFTQDKLGLKITLYNSDNNKVSGTSLLGTLFYVNDIPYSANLDGSIRLKVADNVANVNTKVVMDLSKSNLATDTYKMVIETFGSPDGLYFGTTESFVIEKTIKIVNEKYGLKSTIQDEYAVIVGETGKNVLGNSDMKFNIEYSSRFSDPNIRVRLYRRNYDDKYSLEYSLVDLQEYVSTELTKIQDNEYLVSSSPVELNEFNLQLKENLTTGTYKMVFEIYNGENYIDDVFNYIFIK